MEASSGEKNIEEEGEEEEEEEKKSAGERQREA